jgi:hypothetical protein
MSKGENKRLISQLDKLIDDFTGVHSKRMNEILATMDDDEFSVTYFKLMEYARPKLQRSEVVGNDDKTLDVNITVIKEKVSE